MKTITNAEYKRRVFNHVIVEACTKFSLACSDVTKADDPSFVAKCVALSDSFYRNLLNLDTSTISQTKENLAEAVSFVQDILTVAETVAAGKAELAKEEKLEIPEDQKVELSEEEEDVLNLLYTAKKPELQIDAVRDATVKAMLKEDQKAQEIKDALSIAQSQVASGEDPKAMEETVNRLSSNGPTSLMNGIMNRFSAVAVKEANQDPNKPTSVKQAMQENSDSIRNSSMFMYSLFESASVLGLHKFTTKEVKDYADQFYFGN